MGLSKLHAIFVGLEVRLDPGVKKFEHLQIGQTFSQKRSWFRLKLSNTFFLKSPHVRQRAQMLSPRCVRSSLWRTSLRCLGVAVLWVSGPSGNHWWFLHIFLFHHDWSIIYIIVPSSGNIISIIYPYSSLRSRGLLENPPLKKLIFPATPPQIGDLPASHGSSRVFGWGDFGCLTIRFGHFPGHQVRSVQDSCWLMMISSEVYGNLIIQWMANPHANPITCGEWIMTIQTYHHNSQSFKLSNY